MTDDRKQRTDSFLTSVFCHLSQVSKTMQAIAIDIGATNTKLALVSSKSIISNKKVYQTEKFKNKNSLINEVCKFIKNMSKSYGVKSCGIACPGPVNFENGRVHFFINLKGWDNVPIKSIIEKKTGCKVLIDNDVNLAAIAEFLYGAGKGYKNIVCLTLGTGVGGGIIIGGKLYRGTNSVAGEIGHMPLNLDGPKCNCGSKGCLESYVGNRYIVNEAINLAKNVNNTKMLDLCNGNLKKLTPQIIAKAATLNDKIALKTWENIGYYIGRGLSGVVNLLNPEIIIIGGGIGEAGEVLFSQIRKTISEYAISVHAKSVKLVKAKLGQNASLIGAASLFFKK